MLVGASLGGMYARLFAAAYPDQVAGIVLVDARHEDFTRENVAAGGDEQIPRGGDCGDAGWGYSHRHLPGHDCQWAYVTEELRLFSSESRESMIAELMRPGYLKATMGELQAMEATEGALRSAGGLGELPLVVLTHGVPFPDATQEDIWQEHQVKTAALSSRGKLVVAAESGHNIQIDQPELVVAAVLEVMGR